MRAILQLSFPPLVGANAVNELYPSDAIIALAMAKGIPFTTASDAHSHVQFGGIFVNLAGKMAEIGIRQVCIFEKHKRAAAQLQL